MTTPITCVEDLRLLAKKCVRPIRRQRTANTPTDPTAPISAVVYDFSPGRSGEYARNFRWDARTVTTYLKLENKEHQVDRKLERF
jgi:hypothetical protein